MRYFLAGDVVRRKVRFGETLTVEYVSPSGDLRFKEYPNEPFRPAQDYELVQPPTEEARNDIGTTDPVRAD